MLFKFVRLMSDPLTGYVSAISKIPVPVNDSFVRLNSIRLPGQQKSASYRRKAASVGEGGGVAQERASKPSFGGLLRLREIDVRYVQL